MKNITAVISFFFVTVVSFSQIYDPVEWSFSYEKNKDNNYDLVFTATIEEKSHLYSMRLPDGGPIPTSFTFEKSDDYELLGETREMNEGEVVFDQAFEMEIKYFSGEAEFRQTVSSSLDNFSVKGYVTYMACDDERCSPPQDKEFNITVSGGEQEEDIPAPGSRGIDSDNRGLIGLLLVSFLLGMAAILTPCVFPMIPMTVAFFFTGNRKQGQIIY